MKITLHVLVLVFAGLHTTTAVELPEAAIADFLAKQQMPQIQGKPKARLQRDFEERWLKWFERTVTEPFATRLKSDAAVREQALNLARKGIMQIRKSPQRDPAFTAATMVTECEALLKAGVNDPLVHWLHGMAIYDSAQDFPGYEAAYKKAARHPKFKEMPSAQRLLTMADFERIASESRRSTTAAPRGEDIIETAWLSIQEGVYQPDEDEILDENLWPVFRSSVLPKNETLVQEICGTPALSEWATQMLTGRYHERKAWLARGHAFADKVKPEGWLGFEESRVKAVGSFMKAWKLRPESPIAVRELLGISLTGGNTGEKPLVWLDRVLDAQFDHLSSFRSLMNGLLPRWGGSHQQMLAFGLSCAATKRFDTEVPYFFFQVLQDLARDSADWRVVCRHPLVSQTTVALCKQRVQDAPTPELKQEALKALGAYGWICGDYQAATAALALAPSSFSRALVVQMLSFHGWNEQRIRSESVIFAAGHEQEWRAAEQALEEKNLDAAEAGFRAVRAKVQGIGAVRTDSRLAQVRFERSFASGGWVTLQVDPTLAGWQVQKGDWSGTPEGRLIHRGAGTSAFIYNLGRVGTEFQMRGEFEAGKSGFGVVIGHGDDEAGTERWLTCVMKRGEAYFMDRFFACGLEKRKMSGPPSPTKFLITCHDGKITFEVNEQEIYTEAVPTGYYEPHPPLQLVPDGHIGFCLPMFEKGNLSTVLRSEVRLLPADFKPGESAPKDDPR